MFRQNKIPVAFIIVFVTVFCLGGLSPVNAGSYNLNGSTGFHIPETGYALLIDLDVYTMTVYHNGQVYKSFPVSGGAIETPSPVGTWVVTVTSDWGAGFGGSWIGLNVPWGNYGIHGTGKPWLVGKNNVSHGCIRMKNEDVREVRQLVAAGTVVHIKHDALPFRNMRKDVRGSDVYNTQILLERLGFYTGTIDGIFGDGMTRAVKSFQKTYGLPVDGVIRKGTYEKIVEQERILRNLKFSHNNLENPCNEPIRQHETGALRGLFYRRIPLLTYIPLCGNICSNIKYYEGGG